MNDPRFTFLMCSERSGSNFITKLMDAHPAVCGPSPSHLFRTFAPNLWRYGSLSKESNWDALCGDIVGCLDSQLGVWATSASVADLRKLTERSLSAALTYIYRTESQAHGASHVFVKENHAARVLPFYLTAFPDSTFVFLVRDPRDMVLSLKRSVATPGGVLRGVDLWLADQRENLSVLGILEGVGRIRLVRYEDLITEPEAELRSICELIGVEFSATMLRFHEGDLTRANAARVDAWQNLSRPIMRTNSGGYENGLSELEIRFVESVCATEMARFGYERDHPVGDAKELRSALEDREMPSDDVRHESLSESERETRQARLQMIERVLARDLWTA